MLELLYFAVPGATGVAVVWMYVTWPRKDPNWPAEVMAEIERLNGEIRAAEAGITRLEIRIAELRRARLIITRAQPKPKRDWLRQDFGD
jgi:hypothetical protein